MDHETLLYYASILLGDASELINEANPQDTIPDDKWRRALNARIEAIRADIANLQFLIDG